MVLSKGQKIILIAVGVFIVIASAFLGYQLYRSTQSKMNDAIEPVMGGYALSFADPYDAETSKDFIEEYWNPVKDKSSFHKKFVKQLQTQVIDLSFQNAGLDSDDQIENEFGETVTNAHGVIVEMMPFLKRVNYEDEPLKECLKNYYIRLAEDMRTDLQNGVAENGAESKQEQELNTAERLLSVLDKVSAFNDAAAEYYQINENDIIPIDEISQHYNEAIQLSLDANDSVTLVTALSQASESPLLADQTFMDSEQIADFFIADDAEIYTLQNGVGGYYDTVKIDESGVSYYGDFATRTYTSGGNKYDTSAFTPGLWNSLSPGQRSEIRSGNSSKTHYNYYFLGKELDSSYSSDISELAQSGYGYVYCNPDGSAMFVSAKSATCYTKDIVSRIEGDFSKLVDRAAEKYNVSGTSETPSTSAIQGAVTEFLAGNYDAAVDQFLEFSDNGSRLTPICQFVEQMAQSGYYDECIDLIYDYLNLSDQDMVQFETFLSELPQ